MKRLISLCLILTLLIGILVYVYLKFTKQGYEIAVVGDSTGTARYAGMKVNAIVLRTVFLSAALIGLAAAFKVGTAGILSTAITDDVGWTGIIADLRAALRFHGGSGNLLPGGLQLREYAPGCHSVPGACCRLLHPFPGGHG